MKGDDGGDDVATTWTHGGLFRSGTNYAMDGVRLSSQAPAVPCDHGPGFPLPFLRAENTVMAGTNGPQILVDCRRLRSAGFKIRATS